jgi:hypothetical protein
MNDRLRRRRGIRALALTAVLFGFAGGGCRKAVEVGVGETQTRIALRSYGLSADYSKHDGDTDCTGHVIGYRSVICLTPDLVSVVFNTHVGLRQGGRWTRE